MQMLKVLTAIGLAMMASLATATSLNSGPPDTSIEDDLIANGYTIVPLTFDTTNSAGESITLRGTVQEIAASFARINPEATLDMNPTAKNSVAVASIDIQKLDCGAGEFASLRAINDGVHHLRGLEGELFLDPEECSRVSCSYDGAIWVCGDGVGRGRRKWSEMAELAEYIVHNCQARRVLYQVRGMAVDRGQFKMYITNDDC